MTDSFRSPSAFPLRTPAVSVDANAISRLLQEPWPVVTLRAGRREAKNLFEAAVTLAEPGITCVTLEPALHQLLMLSVVRLPDAVARELKRWRQNAAAVRSLWSVFGEGHVPPASFDSFVRNFGRLNDAIFAKDGGRAREEARELMIAVRAGDALSAVDTFKPTGRPETVRFLEESRADIEDAFARDTLDAAHFHEIRKTLKHFMNALRFQAVIYPDQAVSTLAERTMALNEILGRVQDQLVLRSGFLDSDPREVDVHLPSELNAAGNALFAALTL